MLPPLLQAPKPYLGVFVPWCKRGELGNWCLQFTQGIQGWLSPSETGQPLNGTRASPLESGMLRPRNKTPGILQSIQTPQSSCLPLGGSCRLVL